jgi:hypothetical protein
MVDVIDGYATIGGAAKVLQSSYWAVYEIVRRKKIPTTRLTGSTAVLVRVADVAALVKPK